MTKIRLIIFKTLLALVYVIPAQAQTWQSLYDQAQKAFQNEDYNQAIQLSEQALLLAKGNEFLKPRAFTLQLITAAAAEYEQPALIIKYIEAEKECFVLLETEGQVALINAYQKHIQAYLGLRQFDDALVQSQLLIQKTELFFGSHSVQMGEALVAYGQLLASLEKPQQALEPLQKGLPLILQSADVGEDYLYGLFSLGASYYALKQVEEGQKQLNAFIRMAEQNQLKGLLEYKEAQRMINELALEGDDTDKLTLLNAESGLSADRQLKILVESALQQEKEQNFQAALDNYSKADQIIIDKRLQSALAFSAYYNAARLLHQLGLLKEAEPMAQQGQKVANVALEPDRSEWLLLHSLQARIAADVGKQAAAEQFFKLAEDKTAKASADARLTFIMARSVWLSEQFRYRSALEFVQSQYHAAIALWSPEQALGLQRLQIELQMQLGQNEAALAQLQKINTASLNTVQVEAFKLLQVEALLLLGNYQEALNLCQQLPSNSQEHNRARMLLFKGKAEERLAKYAEAEQSILQAIKLLQASGNYPETLTEVQNSLGTFYITLGNYAAAENYFNTLIKNSQSADPLFATYLQNLASVYQLTLRYTEALTLLEKGKEIDAQKLGRQHPDYAIALQNLAGLYHKLGDLSKAQLYYEEALRIDAQNSGKQSLSYATKLSNLGVVFQELGELKKAEDNLAEALQIREQKLGQRHPDYAFNLYNLAVLKQKNNDMAQAHQLFNQSLSIYLKQIQEIFPSLSEQEKTAFYNRIKPMIAAYQDFAVEYGPQNSAVAGELYNFRMATKALLMTASAKVRQNIMNSGDDQLIALYQQWVGTKEELAKLYSLSLDELSDKAEYLKQLESKANTLEKSLSAASNAFSSQVSANLPNWQDIKSSLSNDEAAMEIIRLKLNIKQDSVAYLALIIKANSIQPTMVLLRNGNELENREFKAYINSIKFKVVNPRAYAKFWQSFEPELTGVKKLYLSSDGIYNKISVPTLYNPVSKQFIIEQLQISLLSNTRELLQTKSSPNRQSAAVLVGYPNYSQSDENKPIDYQTIAQRVSQDNPDEFGLTRGGISLLPGTKAEVEGIAQLLQSKKWSAQSYLFDQATEDQIKRLNNPAVLHIATHGFFIENTDNSKDWVYSTSMKDSRNNPLLRSGLLLTGAESSLADKLSVNQSTKSGEDGILTAYEAMNLQLDQTDLVVLSACETGSGEVSNGEGVYGLQRAFIVAGSKNLLMSLWKVNDNATQELMQLFYAEWLNTPDKQAALRKAQLSLMKKFPEPYYWGAFVLIGK